MTARVAVAVAAAGSWLLGGCFVAPALPSVTTPRANRFRREGTTLAAGLTLPTFGATYLRGGARVEALHGPRTSILALQMIAAEGRHPLSEGCDLGVQLGLGRSGGELRCGLGSARATVAARANLQWVYTEGVTLRALVDAGYRHAGWLAFVSTGLGAGGFYGRALYGDASVTSAEQLFVAPARTLAVVSQWELAWTSSLALGWPLGGRTTSAFLAYTLDVPVAYTRGSFSEVSGAETLSDLRPGVRVGVMLGVSGVLAP